MMVGLKTSMLSGGSERNSGPSLGATCSERSVPVQMSGPRRPGPVENEATFEAAFRKYLLARSYIIRSPVTR